MTLRTGNRSDKPVEPSPRRAFTLIELILVMALLTIVIAVAAPTLSHFFHGRTLDSEARRLLALTRHAQSRAVSEGVPMVLWVDAKSRTYGLEEEASYDEQDPKALQFSLDKDLAVEVIHPDPVVLASIAANASANAGGAASLIATARASAAAARGAHRSFPAIRFQPDGFFSDTSPRALRLYQEDGAMLWLVRARNHSNYEIQSKINPLDELSR